MLKAWSSPCGTGVNTHFRVGRCFLPSMFTSHRGLNESSKFQEHLANSWAHLPRAGLELASQQWEPYLSMSPFCLRMRYTSAEVWGPWSFCPFSISFSNSSMVLKAKDKKETAVKTGELFISIEGGKPNALLSSREDEGRAGDGQEGSRTTQVLRDVPWHGVWLPRSRKGKLGLPFQSWRRPQPPCGSSLRSRW